VPFLHPGGLGQWQESGRDQGHTVMGIGFGTLAFTRPKARVTSPSATPSPIVLVRRGDGGAGADVRRGVVGTG
jgi:hypothetical protein